MTLAPKPATQHQLMASSWVPTSVTRTILARPDLDADLLGAWSRPSVRSSAIGASFRKDSSGDVRVSTPTMGPSRLRPE
jgi:hypothetical protein